MSDPSLALQAALVAALTSSAAVSALIGNRVYDRVPPSPTFPYISLGEDQTLADHAECLEGSVEISTGLHVWSRPIGAKAGKVEAKQIAGAIVTALNNATLTLTDYRLVLIEHESSRHLDDPDGITAHSIVTFRSLIDEA